MALNGNAGVRHRRGSILNAAALFGLCLLLSLQLGTVGAKWVTLGDSAVVAIHSVLMPRTNRIYFVDRKSYSGVTLKLPDGTPAAGSEFAINGDTGKVTRGMVMPVDPICSGGMQDKDGTVFWVGGGEATRDNPSHNKTMSMSVVCRNGRPCNYVRRVAYDLYVPRWYPSVQMLPDGVSMFVLGGSAKGRFNNLNYTSKSLTSYELVPHPPGWTQPRRIPALWPRVIANALYPIVHLLPSGLLFILSDTKAILFDPIAGTTAKTLPRIPPPSRTFPVAAISVLLPLAAPFTSSQVLVCGGADTKYRRDPATGLYAHKATRTCGRMSPEASRPVWEKDEMPTPRVLAVAVLTPEGRVVVVGGAGEGSSGEWQTSASDPQKKPAIYTPTKPLGSRWQLMNDASPYSRGYHSSAILYVDGRIIMSGSNPNPRGYHPTGIWPTQRAVEAYTPPNLMPANLVRPVLTSYPGVVKYGRRFIIKGTASAAQFSQAQVKVAFIYTGFSTHGLNMGQRHVFVDILSSVTTAGPSPGQVALRMELRVPTARAVLPPGYYMMFLVNKDVSSIARWVKVGA